MITLEFLLKVMLSQGLFLVAYYLLIDRSPLASFKRVYLLASLVFSFFIPVLPIGSPDVLARSYEGPELVQISLNMVRVETAVPGVRSSEPADWLSMLLWCVYLAGVSYQLFRLGRFLNSVSFNLSHGIRKDIGGIREVVLPYALAPHTFLRWVFYARLPMVAPAVLAHERAHARQWHSLDRLLVAGMRTLWWWNPMLYVYDRCISGNHEVLADRAVLAGGHSLTEYQQLILDSLRHPQTAPYLASPAGYSLTKLRFAMMTSNKPSLPQRLVRYALLAGLVMATVWTLGANRSNNSSLSATPPPSAVSDTVQPPPPPPAELRQQMRPLQAVLPTPENLREWKNGEIYGVWIDGKRIPNQQLDAYAPGDFAHVINSRLLANAKNRDKHDYQIDLYTVAYFHTLYRRTPEGNYEWIGREKSTEVNGMGNLLEIPPFERRMMKLAGGGGIPGEGC